jgi:hypothetical protein
MMGPTADWWDAYVEGHKKPTPSIGMSSKWLSNLIMYLKVLSISRRSSRISSKDP